MKKKLLQTTFNPVDVVLKTTEDGDRKILHMLAKVPMIIRRDPAVGLVMMSVKDATGADFHLGEVLVTEAEVEYQGQVGYAMIVGNHPEKALARACAAAVLESSDKALQTHLRRYLRMKAAIINKEERIAEALRASTIVNFETMTQW
jgi:alpha-D-ribose 1-methylphosphonate 5-triphosphate synthase subunit PhnG